MIRYGIPAYEGILSKSNELENSLKVKEILHLRVDVTWSKRILFRRSLIFADTKYKLYCALYTVTMQVLYVFLLFALIGIVFGSTINDNDTDLYSEENISRECTFPPEPELEPEPESLLDSILGGIINVTKRIIEGIPIAGEVLSYMLFGDYEDE